MDRISEISLVGHLDFSVSVLLPLSFQQNSKSSPTGLPVANQIIYQLYFMGYHNLSN